MARAFHRYRVICLSLLVWVATDAYAQRNLLNCQGGPITEWEIPYAPDELSNPETHLSAQSAVHNAAYLGEGFIELIGESDFGKWRERINLPFFVEPEGEPAAWLVKGWLYKGSVEARTPFKLSNMIETGYENASFVVIAQKDHWLLVRLLDEPDLQPLWINACYLQQQHEHAQYNTWEQWLFDGWRRNILFYRSPVRHALRSAPSSTADLLMWIPAQYSDYHLSLKEMNGDWALVEMTMPSNYCLLPGEIEVEKFEGWIKWRDEEKGPWLWYYTRGC